MERIIRPVLFGRHVGQGSSDELGSPGRLALAGEARSDPEPGEPGIARRLIDKHTRRLRVFVDQRLLV